LLKNYYNLPIIVDEKEELNLSKLRNVYSIIKNNYFDADEIKKEDLIDEAIS
jgi:hypothetical protein